MFVSTVDELDHPALHALDDAESLLDRSAPEDLLSPIYGSRTGRPSYPHQTLFLSLLLGVRYGLSDVRLSQCLCRDLPFRRFCRLEFGGGVPDATTLGRFRSWLVKHDLRELLPGEVNRQLEEQGVAMTRGRVDIVDATPVEAARSGRAKRKDGKRVRDPEGGLHVERDGRGRMKSAWDYSVHAGVDGDGYRGRPLSAADTERNAAISVVRSGVERVFAVYERCYGLGRTRFPGLAKNMTFYGLAAIALNIRKGACFLRLYGVRAPVIEG